MVQANKVELGGTPYLNKKTVLEKKVTKVKILTEPVFVDSEYEGKTTKKLSCECSTQVAEPKKVIWEMNPTTQNYMIDKHGSETKSWVGLEIDIAVKQAGSASPGIYPTGCSLEKVLA
jgi:hypothetical protein